MPTELAEQGQRGIGRLHRSSVVERVPEPEVRRVRRAATRSLDGGSAVHARSRQRAYLAGASGRQLAAAASRSGSRARGAAHATGGRRAALPTTRARAGTTCAAPRASTLGGRSSGRHATSPTVASLSTTRTPAATAGTTVVAKTVAPVRRHERPANLVGPFVSHDKTRVPAGGRERIRLTATAQCFAPTDRRRASRAAVPAVFVIVTGGSGAARKEGQGGKKKVGGAKAHR